MHLTTRSLFFQPNSKRLPLLKFKLNSFEFSFLCVYPHSDSSFAVTSRATKFRTETNSPKFSTRKSDNPCFIISAKRFILVTREKVTPAYSQSSLEKFEFETNQQDLNRLSTELDLVMKYTDEEGFVNLIYGVRYKELAEIIQTSEDFDSDEMLMDKKVSRLCFEGLQLGAFFLTTRSLHFYVLVNAVPDDSLHLPFSGIILAMKYKYLHRDVGLSLHTHTFPVIFLFENKEQRDSIYDFLLVKLKFKPVELETSRMTEKWRTGNLSNFEYLMFVNHLANRSPLDSAQYPIFPWVLKNYHDKGKNYLEIDLKKISNFRDLSQPIGSLNESRLIRYQNRFQELNEYALYPIFSSNNNTILYYLIRKYPEIILRQQNSIYTTTDKLFESIEKSFGSSLNNFADVKELIPEFYSRNPEFLVNWHRMEVTKEKAVKNVELPEWCKTPDEFCAIMRCALDSDIASESLNLWLDLVFGYKQNSMEFHNSFSPDCYSFDWNSCKNEISKRAMVVVLKEYGIAPEKVFNQMHSLKSFRIRVVSGYDTEVKMKMQKLQNQIQNLMQIHNKEYKAQEKQYKQLLTQETQEKNQEVLELKGKLSELRGHYALIAQQFEETVKQRNESNIQNAEKRIKSKRDGKHY